MVPEYLLLGLLRRPSTPFELKVALDEGALHLAPSDLRRIETALASMEERGWIEIERGSVPGPHADLAQRTAAGEEELGRWLREGTRVEPDGADDAVRMHLLDQLSGAEESDAAVLVYREQLELWGRELDARARSSSGARRAPRDLTDGDFRTWLSLELARRTCAARIAWCDDALRLSAERRRGGPTEEP